MGVGWGWDVGGGVSVSGVQGRGIRWGGEGETAFTLPSPTRGSELQHSVCMRACERAAVCTDECVLFESSCVLSVCTYRKRERERGRDR